MILYILYISCKAQVYTLQLDGAFRTISGILLLRKVGNAQTRKDHIFPRGSKYPRFEAPGSKNHIIFYAFWDQPP